MEANSRMLLLIVLIHFCLKVTVQSRMVDHPMDYNNVSLTIRMPNVVSHKADSLVCMSKKLDAQESYIVKFTPHASAKTAHHMMVFGCPDVPRDPGESWLCNSRMNDESVCQSSMEEILFAWALDAPEKKLPDGVGLRVGGTTGINYVVVQLHYARAFEGGETDNSGVTLHMTTARPPMQVGYYIFASFGAVPPQQEEVHVEASCEFQLNYTIYPIGYRTHAHNLGVVTAGYRIRDGQWLEIGRMSPQNPQTFYPISNPGMDIRPGDVLASRCTMNSMSRTAPTYMGPANHDEMCNFYIMYSTYYQENLVTKYCMRQTPDFKWSERLQEFFPLPESASSLDGIPNKEKLREKFQTTI